MEEVCFVVDGLFGYGLVAALDRRRQWTAVWVGNMAIGAVLVASINIVVVVVVAVVVVAVKVLT